MTTGTIDFEADHFSWREEGGGVSAANHCLAFLAEVGIEVGPLGDHEAQLLEGLAIINGRLLIYPDTPVWPGDLLHEAGHIAVAAPQDRKTLGPVDPDGADEMAAIAWSYAAAQACGVGLEQLFHDGGYRGDSASLRAAFANGSYIGAPMLGFFGLTDPDGHDGDHPFPAMIRWLR
ncbi:MAG: hypothetical protein AAGE86_10800 [Pseudomonadota bacterium]